MSEKSAILKHIIETVSSGERIKVKCKKEWEIDGPDVGMVCDIIRIDTHDTDPDELAEEEILVHMDFMPYIEYNKGFANKTWYDHLGDPRLTWFETIHWKKNQGVEELYMMNNDFEKNFEIQLAPLFLDFLNSEESKKGISYTKFLENTVMMLSHKILSIETKSIINNDIDVMDDKRDSDSITILESFKKKPLKGVGYLMDSEKIFNKAIDEAISFLRGKQK
jgi:hypothetical protein